MPLSLSPISSQISLDPFLNTTARETRFAKPDTFEGRDSKFVLGVRLSVMELADALPTTGHARCREFFLRRGYVLAPKGL